MIIISGGKVYSDERIYAIACTIAETFAMSIDDAYYEVEKAVSFTKSEAEISAKDAASILSELSIERETYTLNDKIAKQAFEDNFIKNKMKKYKPRWQR